MKDYIISCSSPVDVDFDFFIKRGVHVLFYNYIMDGMEYEDIMGRSKKDLDDFYSNLGKGIRSYTSQVSIDKYVTYFEQLLKEKKDILHIELGTGMTNSVLNALKAVELIKEKYPDSRIEIIDSLCSSSGYGMLVDSAVDLKNQDLTIDELAMWIKDNRQRLHHQFFCTDLSFFKRSGRITMMTAIFGGIMKTCPIMKLNNDGKIVVYSKAFGKKNAIKKTVEEVMEHIKNGQEYHDKLWINHSNCPHIAEMLQQELIKALPQYQDNIKIWNIGTTIGSHCGPGTVAVFFYGDEREE